MVMNKICFISYVDMRDAKSGSRVRPNEMLQSFKEKGFDVLELTGEQTAPDRRKKVDTLLNRIESERPEFCYIESPTYPIMKHCDRKLIKTLHKKGIKIGYFYRDFYRKFPQFRKKGFVRAIKDIILDFLQWRTDSVLKYCDIVYFPSNESKELFNFHDMRVLPPAGNNYLPKREKAFNYTCIYVGGILGHYDGKLLLDSFNELVKRDHRFKLILVCRVEEWNIFEHPLKQEKWLEIHHTSGKGLAELYNRALIALIPLVSQNENIYNKYAIPVKTFEYISYGLPIVSVCVQALKRLIEEERIGIVVDSTPSAIADGIQRMTSSKKTYEEYCKKVKNALLNRNLWSHRVETVKNDLTSVENTYAR